MTFGTEFGRGADLLTDRRLSVGREVVTAAREIGAAPAQVAPAWLRRRTGARVIPIVGARHAGQLEDSLGCLGVETPPELLARLDAKSAVHLGFRHWFLAAPGIRGLVCGEKVDDIDDHRR